MEVPDETDAPASTWARLANGYLNGRLGYEQSPSAKLGAVIVPLIPHRRALVDRAVRHLPRPRAGVTLLDVGCGDGRFVNRANAMGWRASGIDVDARAVDGSRRRGLPVEAAELGDLVHRTPAPRFDAITMSHVVEHLYDPLEALELSRRLLKPGGVIWIATPNVRGLVHRRFGRDWVALDPPRHLTVLSPDALVGAVRGAGFDDVMIPAAAPAFAAQFMWDSAARGWNPDRSGSRSPTALQRLRLMILERAQLLSRKLSDELVVIARRPGG
ncbi:MAG: class I SAM-dependent methyltransferase [Solirubrobacterales bacterium]